MWFTSQFWFIKQSSYLRNAYEIDKKKDIQKINNIIKMYGPGLSNLSDLNDLMLSNGCDQIS